MEGAPGFRNACGYIDKGLWSHIGGSMGSVNGGSDGDNVRET